MSDARRGVFQKLADPVTRAVMGVVIILLLSVHLFLWAGPIDVSYDLPTLLLAAASVTVVGISVLLAVVAAVGWKELESRIAKQVREATRDLEAEHKAMTYFAVGLLFGKSCKEEGEDGRDTVTKPDVLQMAISYTKKAVELFPPSAAPRSAAVNNLAYYYSLEPRKEYGQAAARHALETFEEYQQTGNRVRARTYASVLAAFPEHFDGPRYQLATAIELMEEIADDGRRDIPEDEKARARRIHEDLKQALNNVDAILEEHRQKALEGAPDVPPAN